MDEWADRAAKLFYLEERDRAISAHLHALMAERSENKREALKLRCSLTVDEVAEYELLKLEAAAKL